MHINNKHFGLVLALVAASLMGCGGRPLHTEWDSSRGHGHVNPITGEFSSSEEYSDCRADPDLRELREDLLCEIGLERHCSETLVEMSEGQVLSYICSAVEDVAAREECILRFSTGHTDRMLTLGRVVETASADDPARTWLRTWLLANQAQIINPLTFCTLMTADYGAGTVGGVGTVGGPLGGVGTLGATTGGSLPFSASVIGVTLAGPGVGVGIGGAAGGTSYPVRSTLPRNWYAQFQINATNTGALLASGAVGNVAAGTALGLVPTSMSVPLPVTSGTMITITWACVDATGANPSVTNSITGPVGIGFDINPDRCGIRSF